MKLHWRPRSNAFTTQHNNNNIMNTADNPLPEGFIDLSTARQAAASAAAFAPPSAATGRVDIIGVVVDKFDAPLRMKGGDFMLRFTLLDRQLHDSAVGSTGLLCTFFHKHEDMLPQVKSIGDIVLIRRISLKMYQGQPCVLSNWDTVSLVFSSAAVPSMDFVQSIFGGTKMNCRGTPDQRERLKNPEQMYIVRLKKAMETIIAAKLAAQGTSKSQYQSGNTIPPLGRAQKADGTNLKFRLVKDVSDRTFVDLIGQVVKCFATQYGVDLYITDYTPNELVQYYSPPEGETSNERDGDTYGYAGPPKRDWPGPYEFLVLKLNVKPPHAEYAASNIQQGDFVSVKNVKTRIAPNGRLEGDMWPDDKWEDRVRIGKVTPVGQPEIEAICKRRDSYWAARGLLTKDLAAKHKKEEAENEGQNAARKKDEKKTDKRSAAKKRKRERERELALAAGVAPPNSTEQGNAAAPTQTLPFRSSKSDPNPHIRCSNDTVPLMRINEILDPTERRHKNRTPGGKTYILPYVNATHRAKVRVVDFQPLDLEDFAIPAAPAIPDGEDQEMRDADSVDWQSTQKWEWNFMLLLEDATDNPTSGGGEKPKSAGGAAGETAKERMWVSVHHANAQFLFGRNLGDPEDLRANPPLLTKLREQLFVLWGDLEERKNTKQATTAENAPPQNLPFECCVFEYGLPTELEDVEGVKIYRDPGGSSWARMHGLRGTTIQ